MTRFDSNLLYPLRYLTDHLLLFINQFVCSKRLYVGATVVNTVTFNDNMLSGPVRQLSKLKALAPKAKKVQSPELIMKGENYLESCPPLGTTHMK